MNAIVEFQKPRLPWHPAVEERFGVDKSGWKVLVEAIFPSARSVDSVTMALGYCKARKLDPFKRPVHIVPVWDSSKDDYVETVWPAIAELPPRPFPTFTIVSPQADRDRSLMAEPGQVAVIQRACAGSDSTAATHRRDDATCTH